MELSWLLFYAYLGARSSNWLLTKGRAKLFNRLTGGVFIGAGALLSFTNRT
jgi:threonine/homoserine/homoserine lactone efflux protein